MLQTIRAFAAERLAARPDVGDIERRHADQYRALAEQADRPLRGVGQGEWVERLQAEVGNLAAAARWYLGHDRAPVPHLFRVLWPFWFLRDHVRDVRPWIDQLLPGIDSFDPQARAELAWIAAAAAVEMGEDAALVAARERLAPLLDGIEEPLLHAVSLLTVASLTAVLGDRDEALRAALASLAELRGQDEPFWIAQGSLAAGTLEMAVGRLDDAQPHLREVYDLGRRLDSDWLTAWARVQLGNLATVRGRLDEARNLLDDGLQLSVATHSTRTVNLCLAAFARLAFAEGDSERAALLAGAAAGLLRRVSLRPWPGLPGGGGQLEARLREALGAQRFDQVYAAGSRLDQREAVAAVRDGHRAADTP